MKKNITLPLPIVLAQFIFMLLITAFVVVPKLVSAQSLADLLVHFDQSGGNSWINTGSVGIGTSNPLSKFDITSTNEETHLYLSTYDDEAAESHLIFLKSKTDTIGDMVQTETNDVIGGINFYGVNSSAAKGLGAGISVIQDGNAGSTRIPGTFEFYTYTNANTRNTPLVLNSNGSACLGNC